jgi:hypothetical protein
MEKQRRDGTTFFNRRYDLAAIIPRLTWAAVRLQLSRARMRHENRGARLASRNR